jgi:hypothetical protein
MIHLTNGDNTVGAISGSITGLFTYIATQSTALDTIIALLVTGVVAITTGFLGALGSHLFKVLKDKLKK